MSFDQTLDKDEVLDQRILFLSLYRLKVDFINRRNAGVPDTFVPSTKYVAVADDSLLLLVHPTALDQARQTTGLNDENIMEVERPGSDGFVLFARRYGNLWGIERQREYDDIHEVLVFDRVLMPVVHRKPHGAIALAMNCHPNPRKDAECLRWVPITTNVVEYDLP